VASGAFIKTDDDTTTTGTAAAMKPHIVFVMADGECVIRWLLSLSKLDAL
jgi:hypothetical protein